VTASATVRIAVVVTIVVRNVIMTVIHMRGVHLGIAMAVQDRQGRRNALQRHDTECKH